MSEVQKYAKAFLKQKGYLIITDTDTGLVFPGRFSGEIIAEYLKEKFNLTEGREYVINHVAALLPSKERREDASVISFANKSYPAVKKVLTSMIKDRQITASSLIEGIMRLKKTPYEEQKAR